MRDAAALMIMKFDDVTRISSLAGSSREAAPIAQPKENGGDADEKVQATAVEEIPDESS
jgi:hypothetical protein